MKDYQVSILNEIVTKYGSSPQIDMAIEEMAELTKALLKYRRLNYGIHPQGEIDKRRKDIADEIADVEILLFQLRNIFSLDRSFIDDIIAEKLERQKLRMLKNDTELKTCSCDEYRVVCVDGENCVRKYKKAIES